MRKCLYNNAHTVKNDLNSEFILTYRKLFIPIIYMSSFRCLLVISRQKVANDRFVVFLCCRRSVPQLRTDDKTPRAFKLVVFVFSLSFYHIFRFSIMSVAVFLWQKKYCRYFVKPIQSMCCFLYFKTNIRCLSLCRPVVLLSFAPIL